MPYTNKNTPDYKKGYADGLSDARDAFNPKEAKEAKTSIFKKKDDKKDKPKVKKSDD